MSDDSAFSMLDLFQEEVRAHTATLNRGLVDWEKNPDNRQKIEPLMRAAHSIKGAARIVNIEAAVHLSHAMEDVFVAAQDGRITIAPADIDVLLKGADILAELSKLNEGDVAVWSDSRRAEISDLQERFRQMTQGQPDATPLPASGTQLSREPSFTPTTDHLPPATHDSPPTSDESSPTATPAGHSPLTTHHSPAGTEVQKVPQPAAEAVVRITAQNLNRLMGLAGESLVQARWLELFATALLKLKKQHDHLAATLAALDQSLTADGRPDQVAGLTAEARRQSGHCREVLAERLRDFQDHAAQAEDLNTRLYREVIASRMRPFADGAQALPRLVRDMARSLGKLVRLDIEGEATEVDRDILEKLEAPLTHLLRNAVDHGIETPEQRRAAGKPEIGTVRIHAGHRAGTLVITVADDGAGINLERLRQKVIERQLASADMVTKMSEPELLEFLFLPGFSTAGALTEYSGRGVGLDVVQNMVRKVGGSVRISTQFGAGTSFHLQLPITLSVLRAVLVEVAGEPYAFPHNRIDRLICVRRTEIRSLEHRQFVTVDGHNVGLVLAAQLLELPAAPPVAEELPVVLLSDSTGHYGLIVESFRGEQDLVVRPLDARLGKVRNISSVAVLDDGSPVLIVDVEDLIRSMDQFIQGNKLRRYDQDQQPAEGQRKRILVVDDSITVREVERQLLRNHGYEVAVAVDGQEGWNLVRAEHFDLVVSDVDMPRMNGLELVQTMRKEPALRQIPVIIVSYKEREEDRLRGLEVGANYYLTKSSFHDNTFLQAVVDLVGES
jgi:two-component system sensor histidine kinase and response regulator WspE